MNKLVILVLPQTKFTKFNTHTVNEGTTFYEELQKKEGLDLRDKRGIKHDIVFILISVLLGLLRNRDGKMSSLHRHIVNNHKLICKALSIDNEQVISRSHLPRILMKVDRKVFEDLIFDKYGIELSEKEKKWFAGDGKELRGSINKGDKRGEAIVQLVEHKSRRVIAQSFFNGTKESEKPCLRNLIKESNLQNQGITADALHLNPETTEPVNKNGGVFLIGLKENQKELFEEMKFNIASNNPLARYQTIDKGHGRLEIRDYEAYELSGAYIDERWNASNFQTVIKVKRVREELKTNALSTEYSYYITNGKSKNYEEYFDAIREHWSVEVSNHYRDVTLKEDKLRTKVESINRIMASCRTVVLEILKLLKPKNMIALLESFQDDFDKLISCLKTLKFL